MHHRKAFSTAAALAIAAGALFMPEGTFARGGGFGGGARGPVFGFPRARIGVHRPIGPGFVRRSPAHFGFRLNAFRLHRAHQRNDANASYPYAGDGSYGGYGSPYGANDATGSVAPGPAYVPLPAAYPPEHVGCLSRGYEVPTESGGIGKVTVTRC